jgi:hypothetical protein
MACGVIMASSMSAYNEKRNEIISMKIMKINISEISIWRNQSISSINENNGVMA